jgi:hypothetical protein
MNREEVIELAREAGWTQYSLLQSVEVQRLEKFASLVAAAEREACAKVCENHHGLIADSLGGYDIADAIRARGEE